MPCRGCGGARRIEPKQPAKTAPQTAEQIVARMPRRPQRRDETQFSGEQPSEEQQS